MASSARATQIPEIPEIIGAGRELLSPAGPIWCKCCSSHTHETAYCLRLWTSSYLTTKNTFLEVVPPLACSALGFQVLRRQISEPSLPSAGLSDDMEDMEVAPLSPKVDAEIVANSPRLSLSTVAASDAVSPASGDDNDDSDREFNSDAFAVPAAELGGEQMSAGSALHGQGQCRPCIFVNSEVGCKEGLRCRFCHYDHSIGKRRIRPCKGKRDRLRRLIDRLKAEVDSFVASERSREELSSHFAELRLPLMVVDNAVLKRSVFLQVGAYAEETYGIELDKEIL